MSDFVKELESLINRHSVENGSNTPDFILADYLQRCLLTFNYTINQLEVWYVRKTSDAADGANLQITNSSGQKLPCFEDVVLSVRLPWKSMSIISTKTQIDIAKEVYDYIASQLRAGGV